MSTVSLSLCTEVAMTLVFIFVFNQCSLVWFTIFR
jgi:hypothetical protein